MFNRESKEFPNKTTSRIAEDINKAKDSIDKNLINLKNTGKTLTEVISGMKAEDTKEKDLKEMAEKVNEDINDYISKYDKIKLEHTQTMQAANNLISHSVVTQVLGAGGMERSKFQKTPKCSI